MNRARFALIVLAMIAISCPLSSGEETVANPKYLAWSRFKPGSSETFEADIQNQGQRYHIQTTQTLISVSDDEVVVETASTGTVQGQKPNESTKRETFKARASPTDLKQIGEKEVDAMGKTFKCKVFEGTGKPAATAAGAKANPTAQKGTIFISDDVPGGLVRLDAIGADGKTQTFILTAIDVK